MTSGFPHPLGGKLFNRSIIRRIIAVDDDWLRRSTCDTPFAQLLNAVSSSVKFKALDREQANKGLCIRLYGNFAALPTPNALRVMVNDLGKLRLGHSHFCAQETQLLAADPGLVMYNCPGNRTVKSSDVWNRHDFVAIIIATGHDTVDSDVIQAAFPVVIGCHFHLSLFYFYFFIMGSSAHMTVTNLIPFLFQSGITTARTSRFFEFGVLHCISYFQ